jgi:GPH family glycoside/pentoside/hexuronide:cation symporter
VRVTTGAPTRFANRVGISALLLIFLLVDKRDTDRYLLLVWMPATAFGRQRILPPSTQAEVIDYDELHTGRRREAQYAGFWSILPKLAAILGAALPIARGRRRLG